MRPLVRLRDEASRRIAERGCGMTPTREDVERVKCAECDCGIGGVYCTWIASTPRAYLAEIAALRERLEAAEAERDEHYQIGLRDGYEKGVQDADQRTGGNGEYVCCVGDDPDDRHCPTPAHMLERMAVRWSDATAALTAVKDAEWSAGYLAGFNASGEGWNGEYPFSDKGKSPDANDHWLDERDADRALRRNPKEGV